MWGSSVPCEDPQSRVRILSPMWGSSVPCEDPQSHVRILSPMWGSSVPCKDPLPGHKEMLKELNTSTQQQDSLHEKNQFVTSCLKCLYMEMKEQRNWGLPVSDGRRCEETCCVSRSLVVIIVHDEDPPSTCLIVSRGVSLGLGLTLDSPHFRFRRFDDKTIIDASKSFISIHDVFVHLHQPHGLKSITDPIIDSQFITVVSDSTLIDFIPFTVCYILSLYQCGSPWQTRGASLHWSTRDSAPLFMFLDKRDVAGTWIDYVQSLNRLINSSTSTCLTVALCVHVCLIVYCLCCLADTLTLALIGCIVTRATGFGWKRFLLERRWQLSIKTPRVCLTMYVDFTLS